MSTLSLAIIVKNEAQVLGHCLGSVQGLVNEMVVVDTGSTDETVSIAKQYGALVTQFPWQDDFAAARNESLRRCTGDWLLILDADEAIDALDHEAIRQTCHQDKIPAFRLTLRNYFRTGSQTTLDEPPQINVSHYSEGREFKYYADFKGLRLCRRLPGVGFQGRIHELLDPFFENSNLPIGSLDAVIHHYGKLMEDREAFKKRYYLTLATQDAKKHPKNHQFQFNLLQQGMMAQDWPVVLKAAQAYMALQRSLPPVVLFGAALALQNLNRHHEAVEHFNKLLSALPAHAPALTQRGISLAVLGRTDEARKSFRKAMESQPGFVLPLLNLSELESAQGQFQVARRLLEQGLDTSPSDPQLLQALVKTDLLSQNLSQAIKDAQLALNRCPEGGQGLWHRLVGLHLIKLGDGVAAAAILDSGLRLFPSDAELIRIRALVNAGEA